MAIAAAADAAAFGMEHHRQRQQHRQQGEEAIGREGGERRQPLALALGQGPSTNRPQAWGKPEPRATGASLMRFLSLRLKPKAAAAPNSGNGAGTGIIVATAYISL